MVSRKRYLEQEAQAEMAACIELGSTSSPEILQRNNLDETWPSFEHKRNRKGEIVGTIEVQVRGQDVFSLATWKKFLLYKGYKDSSLVSLVDDENNLTEEYYSFLTAAHTERYANLDMDGKQWLRKVVRLAVKFHIMRNKTTGYMASLASGVMEEDYICNPYAAFCYQLIQLAKLSGSDVARKIHHIIEKPDDVEYRQLLVKEFFDEHYKRIIDFIRLLAPISPEFQRMAENLEGSEGHYD